MYWKCTAHFYGGSVGIPGGGSMRLRPVHTFAERRTPAAALTADLALSRIDALLRAAREGVAGVVVLRGEPGIGKTFLLREATAHAEGMTVLTARGIGPEAEVPYSGLYDALR